MDARDRGRAARVWECGEAGSGEVCRGMNGAGYYLVIRGGPERSIERKRIVPSAVGLGSGAIAFEIQ
jgi:hypothetical protein